MAITNGYCTLDQLKARLLEMRSYTATTISFTQATKVIADTAFGLTSLKENDVLEVEGSTSNDGFYTIASTNAPGEVTTTEVLTDEAAAASVTLRLAGDYFDDTVLENTINATSRHIDNLAERRFYAGNDTRYYTAQLNDLIFIDDLLSVTSLKTDQDGDGTHEITWTTSDYNLVPYNATADGVPFTMVETTPQGSYRFTGIRRGVEIIGSFGYSATTPPPVNEACLLLAARLFTRKDAPFGVTGSPDVGELRNIRINDPDVEPLLRAYLRVI